MSQVGDDNQDEGENGLLSPPMKYYPINSGAVPFQRWINASDVNTFKEPSNEIRKWDKEREKLGWALSQIGVTEFALQKASELGQILVVFLTQHVALAGENPAVIGSAPPLGSRDRSNALRAVELPPGDGWWFAVCCLPKHSVYDWRWVVMNKRNGKITRGECPRRNTYVHDQHHLHLAKWNLPSIMWALDSLPVHKGSSQQLPYFLLGSFQLKSSSELSEGLDLTIESDDEVFLLSDDDESEPVEHQGNHQHVVMEGNLPFHNGEPCGRRFNSNNSNQTEEETNKQHNGADGDNNSESSPPNQHSDGVVDPNDFTQYLIPVTEPHHKDVPLSLIEVPHKMERQTSDPDLLEADSTDTAMSNGCLRDGNTVEDSMLETTHDQFQLGSDFDLPQTTVIDIFGEPVSTQPSIVEICIRDTNNERVHDENVLNNSDERQNRLLLTPSPTVESQTSDDSKASSDVSSDISPTVDVVPKLFTHLRDSLEQLSSYCRDSNDVTRESSVDTKGRIKDTITNHVSWDLGENLSTNREMNGAYSGPRWQPCDDCDRYCIERLRATKFTEFSFHGIIQRETNGPLVENLPDIVSLNLKHFTADTTAALNHDEINSETDKQEKREIRNSVITAPETVENDGRETVATDESRSGDIAALLEVDVTEEYRADNYETPVETAESKSSVIEPCSNDEIEIILAKHKLPLAHDVSSLERVEEEGDDISSEERVCSSNISACVDSTVNDIPDRTTTFQLEEAELIRCETERSSDTEPIVPSADIPGQIQFAKSFVDVILQKALSSVHDDIDDNLTNTTSENESKTVLPDVASCVECGVNLPETEIKGAAKKEHASDRSGADGREPDVSVPLLMCPEIDREPSDQGYADDDVDDEYTISAEDGILMREMSPHDELATAGSNELEINSDSALFCEDMKTCVSDADFVLRNEGFVADSDIEMTPLKTKKKRQRKTSECSSLTDSVTSNTSLMHEGENSRSLTPVFPPGIWGSFAYFVEYVCNCFCCSENKK
ncbi:uncharacterized protein LOC141905864 [Tubulanus polymorphus]|uniref:uncharacterized protein LOC141905864 n=1 Tax=Tubulanus polymorphus TaxID=672921 RepID=UPI003DA4911D